MKVINTEWKDKSYETLLAALHCSVLTEASADAQEKRFLTLIKSYSLIVHYSFYSAFTLTLTTLIFQ